MVVFETHVELGDTHEGRQRKEARICAFLPQSDWKDLLFNGYDTFYDENVY